MIVRLEQILDYRPCQSEEGKMTDLCQAEDGSNRPCQDEDDDGPFQG